MKKYGQRATLETGRNSINKADLEKLVREMELWDGRRKAGKSWWERMAGDDKKY